MSALKVVHQQQQAYLSLGPDLEAWVTGICFPNTNTEITKHKNSISVYAKMK